MTDIGYPGWEAVYIKGVHNGSGEVPFSHQYIRTIVRRTGASYI